MDPDATPTGSTNAADAEATIRALPLWKGPVEIAPLSGGLTNLNYRVHDGDRAYAVRTGVDDPAIGISRANELSCTLAAARLGIAPRVAYHSPGVLVSEFVESTPLTEELLREAAQIERAARRIREIRDGSPEVTGHLMSFSPFRVARTYLQHAADHGLEIPGDNRLALLERVRELERGSGPFTPTFCHNDMMPGNFLATESHLWIIDWEYAGIGDPLFDLAGLSSNCEFDAAADDLLLKTYSRTIDSPGRARFRILKALAALRESLWAVVHGSQSVIEFDYAAYRDANYAKFERYAAAAPID